MRNIEQWNDWENFLQENEKINLYGTGRMSEYVYQYLAVDGLLEKIGKCYDGDQSKKGTLWHGFLIQSFQNDVDNLPVLIAVGSEYKNEIVQYLQSEGVSNIYTIEEELFSLMRNHAEKVQVQIIENNYLGSINHHEHTNKQEMLFLSPPYWDVYAPFGAVPSLLAKLRAENISAIQFDLGIECFHTLLQEEWENGAKHFMSNRFYRDKVFRFYDNPYKTYEEYKDSLWFFKGESFSVSRIKERYNELNKVQTGVLADFYRYMTEWESSYVNFNNCEADSIKTSLEKKSWLILWKTLERLNEKKEFPEIPFICGISVTSVGQFLPACKLATILRSIRPDIKIVMGGSCADLFMESSYPNKKEIFDYFDYVVVGEGETAVTRLYKHLADNSYDLKDIPNIVYCDKQNQIQNTFSLLESVEDLPTPNFDGLNLERYLAVRPILPYQASRGCHYGFCAFCNHNEKYRHNYRMKTSEKVVRDLKILSQKYEIVDFQFVDEAIRPDHFISIVNMMETHPEFKNIHWLYYSRVSREYNSDILEKAYKNGCRMVMFGIETFNQRLLSFIRKGIDAETSKYCLKLFHDNGIKTFAWMLCNLPSETITEMRGDIDATIQYSKYIDAISLGIFALEANTDMYRNLEEFNILHKNDISPSNFQSHNAGVVIDRKEIMKCYREEYLPAIMRHSLSDDRYCLYFGEKEEG